MYHSSNCMIYAGSVCDCGAYEEFREYPETHQQGTIMLENLDILDLTAYLDSTKSFKGDLGVQIAKDGRVWICINGVAFLRFSPHLDGKMSK